MNKTFTISIFTRYLPHIDSLLSHHLSINISVPANVYIIAYEDQFTPAVVNNQLILDNLVIDTREENLVVVLSPVFVAS